MSDFNGTTVESYFSEETGPSTEPVNVVLFAHPSWDMVLIVEDDANAHQSAIDMLSADDDESEFEIRRHTVTRSQLEKVPEFDG